MSNWPFRFVHASDFHLEMPPFGVSEVPEHLGDLFLESVYRAAERVFETALAEDVDFLILSGDILHCQHTGPRGPLVSVGAVSAIGRTEDRGLLGGGARRSARRLAAVDPAARQRSRLCPRRAARAHPSTWRYADRAGDRCQPRRSWTNSAVAV